MRLTVELTGAWLTAAKLEAPASWRAAVREALAAHGTVSDAADALGVSRRGLGQWIKRDPALARGLTLAGPGRPRGERTGE